MRGDDYDILLHKGHLAKVMGSAGDAIYYYKRSLSLRQDQNDALKELFSLGAFDAIEEILPSDPASKDTSVHTLYLDITDLIEYAKQNTSLSGIQRVVSNIARYSINQPSEGASYRIRIVVPEYDRAVIFSVSAFLICSLIELLERSGSGRDILDNTIRAVYQSRQREDPQPGDIFIIAGAFWIYDHYDLIAALRARNVFFGVFIHDLIQIKNPEYVHREATLVFRKSLIDVLMLANFVLTNSQYVAAEVDRFMRERLSVTLPVKNIPLATELRQPVGRRGGAHRRFLRFAGMISSSASARSRYAKITSIW